MFKEWLMQLLDKPVYPEKIPKLPFAYYCEVPRIKVRDLNKTTLKPLHERDPYLDKLLDDIVELCIERDNYASEPIEGQLNQKILPLEIERDWKVNSIKNDLMYYESYVKGMMTIGQSNFHLHPSASSNMFIRHHQQRHLNYETHTDMNNNQIIRPSFIRPPNRVIKKQNMAPYIRRRIAERPSSRSNFYGNFGPHATQTFNPFGNCFGLYEPRIYPHNFSLDQLNNDEKPSSSNDMIMDGSADNGSLLKKLLSE